MQGPMCAKKYGSGKIDLLNHRDRDTGANPHHFYHTGTPEQTRIIFIANFPRTASLF